MEASAIPVPQGLARTRLTIGAPLLRLRSDEQLVALFRGGSNEAFRVIHDRYRQRLFAYTRQMLPGSRQDAEDALQDVFVRAFGGLRASDRELALRAWLYRIAHNRCVDELRRPAPPAPEVMELVRPPVSDPIEEAEQRESLRRLIEDVRRLPEQQRSALLMRELGGMSYNELAGALGVSVPAVKSLLVRARVSLAQASEARETSCLEIHEDLIVAHDRGVRASGMARRHMHDCASCREFRTRLRGTSRQFAALVPALGPAGMLAKLLGLGGGAGGSAAASGGAGCGVAAGGGAAAGGATAGGAAAGGAAAAGGLIGTGGAVASFGAIASGAGHVATLLAAAVVTAGGAVEIQHSLAPAHHPRHRAAVTARVPASRVPAPVVATYIAPATVAVSTQVPSAAPSSAPVAPDAPDATPAPAARAAPAVRHRRHHASDAYAPLPPKPVLNLTGPYGDSPGATGTGSDAGSATSSGTTGTGTGTGTTSGTGTGKGRSPSDPGQTGTSGSGGAATGSGTPSSGGTSGGDGSGTTPTGGTGTGSGTPSTTGSAGGGSTTGSGPSSPGPIAPTGTG